MQVTTYAGKMFKRESYGLDVKGTAIGRKHQRSNRVIRRHDGSSRGLIGVRNRSLESNGVEVRGSEHQSSW